MAFVEIRERRDEPACGRSAIVASSFAADAAEAVAAIEGLWVDLARDLGTSPGSDAFEWIAVTTPADDLTPPQRINYVAAALGSRRDDWPSDLLDITVEGGHYAVFAYQGPHDGLDEFYRQTYNDELPRLAFASRDGQHLERYLPSGNPDVAYAEAWIPVSLT